MCLTTSMLHSNDKSLATHDPLISATLLCSGGNQQCATKPISLLPKAHTGHTLGTLRIVICDTPTVYSITVHAYHVKEYIELILEYYL